MTLTINGYEVEIKVKDKGNNRFNKKDTMLFLNSLSLMFDYSCERNINKGYDSLAERDRKSSNEIYDFLYSLGYYDDLHN